MRVNIQRCKAFDLKLLLLQSVYRIDQLSTNPSEYASLTFIGISMELKSALYISLLTIIDKKAKSRDQLDEELLDP